LAKRRKKSKNKLNTPAKALTIISEESKIESDNESVIQKRKKQNRKEPSKSKSKSKSSVTLKERKVNNI